MLNLKILKELDVEDKEMNDFIGKSMIIRNQILYEIEEKLACRNKVSNSTDDSCIFDLYVGRYMGGLLFSHDSFFIETGRLILEKINDYEEENRVKVNKEQLFFVLSFLSMRASSHINMLMYWELAQIELSYSSGVNTTLDEKADRLFSNLTSLTSTIDFSIMGNKLVSVLKSKFNIINDFKHIFNSSNLGHKLQFLSCGIQHVNVIGKMRVYNKLKFPLVFSQELINSLCLLNESLLKEKLLMPDSPLGVLVENISNNNDGVRTILGFSNRRTGLYIEAKEDFFNNINDFIDKIENNVSTEDELIAYSLFALHRLRNNSLHNININRTYFSDTELFEKLIGILFVCSFAIISLE